MITLVTVVLSVVVGGMANEKSSRATLVALFYFTCAIVSSTMETGEANDIFNFAFPSTDGIKPLHLGWQTDDAPNVYSSWATSMSGFMSQTARLPHGKLQDSASYLLARQGIASREWKDFKMVSKFKVNGENGDAGVVFRYQGRSSYMAFSMSRKISSCQLIAVEQWSSTVVATSLKSACSLNTGVAYTVTVETHGPRVKVILQDSTVIFDVFHVEGNRFGGTFGFFTTGAALPLFESIIVQESSLKVLKDLANTNFPSSPLVSGSEVSYKLELDSCTQHDNIVEPQGAIPVYVQSSDLSVLSVPQDPVFVNCNMTKGTVALKAVGLGKATISHSLNPMHGNEPANKLVAAPVSHDVRVLSAVIEAVGKPRFEIRGGTIYLEWDAPTKLNNGGFVQGHLLGYSIVRRSGTERVVYGGKGYVSSHFTDTDVTAGTTYTYEVVCMAAAGNSLPSVPLRDVNITMTSPASPPIGILKRAGGSATIAWNPPEDTGGVGLMPMTDQISTYSISMSPTGNESSVTEVPSTPGETSSALENGFLFSKSMIGGGLVKCE